MPPATTRQRRSTRRQTSFLDAQANEKMTVSTVKGNSKGSRFQTTANPKRRKSKKYSFAVFSTSPVMRFRPSSFLTAQESFTEKVISSKIVELKKKNSKRCRIKVMQELESLENLLLARLGMARNLRLDSMDDDDPLATRKHRLISYMEEKVVQLQGLQLLKECELETERELLKKKHTIFICCKVCENQLSNE